MTQYLNRCGDCQNFPGNAKKCKVEEGYQRPKIYWMDLKCGNFKKVE